MCSRPDKQTRAVAEQRVRDVLKPFAGGVFDHPDRISKTPLRLSSRLWRQAGLLGQVPILSAGLMPP